MEVDQIYLVSVADLRDICNQLTQGRYSYQVRGVNKDSVEIVFNDLVNKNDLLELNNLIYEFPIVTNLWFPSNPEDGMLVGLHVYLQRKLQYGLYMEKGEIKQDGLEDWERFWTPLDAFLYKAVNN